MEGPEDHLADLCRLGTMEAPPNRQLRCHLQPDQGGVSLLCLGMTAGAIAKNGVIILVSVQRDAFPADKRAVPRRLSGPRLSFPRLLSCLGDGGDYRN